MVVSPRLPLDSTAEGHTLPILGKDHFSSLLTDPRVSVQGCTDVSAGQLPHTQHAKPEAGPEHPLLLHCRPRELAWRLRS